MRIDVDWLPGYLRLVSLKLGADITITENDCESQRSLRNSKIEYGYAPQQTYTLTKKHPVTLSTLYNYFCLAMKGKWMVLVSDSK